jgi:hypothetical protein
MSWLPVLATGKAEASKHNCWIFFLLIALQRFLYCIALLNVQFHVSYFLLLAFSFEHLLDAWSCSQCFYPATRIDVLVFQI